MRGLWLILCIATGCHSDKIYLDSGFMRGNVDETDPDDGNPRLDTADPDSGEPVDPEDLDGDGDGFTPADGDCDDDDADVHPDAEETCNGLDDNCDGAVDEGLAHQTWYRDADGDGLGDSETTLSACEQPTGFVGEATDCDDENADTYPDAPELCDGEDNDCDTQVDEDVTTRFYRDLDGDGYGSPDDVQDACEVPSGFVADGSDCDDTDPAVNPAGAEVCNDIDDDCDGEVDEGVDSVSWYVDGDGDGFGAEEIIGSVCEEIPSGHVWMDGDCDDADALSFPGATELCDALDNDCDGEIDEGGSPIWYADSDGDGEGDVGLTFIGCDAPDGYVSTPFDCDDTNPDVFPGADEYCNGIDDDCDTEVDETAVDSTIWYLDADGDEHGNEAIAMRSCEAPSGHVADATDCDDADAAVHPDADEICNGIDDDCDGREDIDDDDLLDGLTLYMDSDGDGWGDAAEELYTCEEGSGWSDVSGDCDDDDPEVNPDGVEVCDGLDNDCDGTTDPGALDSDGDGIANCVDETVYHEDFSSGEWGEWDSWQIGGDMPRWSMTGRYLVELSDSANAIAYSPYLGTLDEFTLSVDIMQGGRNNNGCGIAYAVDEGEEVLLVEWRDPTHDYGSWWYPGAIIIYELRGGSWVALDSVSSGMDLSRGYGEWATLSLTVTGSLLQIYLDEELVLAHAYAGALRGPGRVGVWTWDNDGGVYFDNVIVTQPPP